MLQPKKQKKKLIEREVEAKQILKKPRKEKGDHSDLEKKVLENPDNTDLPVEKPSDDKSKGELENSTNSSIQKKKEI